MRLGGPLRGVLYGLGALAVPLAWAWGYRVGAVGIAALVVVGLVIEVGLHFRR